MIEIQQAIKSLYPDAQFAGPANNGGYDKIRWNIKPDGITKEKIDAELIRLQAEYDANQYQRDRQSEYPSISDQLDKIYHEGIDEWKKDIKAVKDKYPKPT
tara:strand:+ start:197 stop:499 length:303 start_codon:yes stop_codon:yes gene_type:complete